MPDYVFLPSLEKPEVKSIYRRYGWKGFQALSSILQELQNAKIPNRPPHIKQPMWNYIFSRAKELIKEGMDNPFEAGTEAYKAIKIANETLSRAGK